MHCRTACLAAALAAIQLASPAVAYAAPTTYVVSGSDAYRVGTSSGHVAFWGRQKLETFTRDGARFFRATVSYSRRDASGTHVKRASFLQETAPSFDGEFVDLVNRDPEYVSVLSQPLSIELRPEDVRELQSLRTRTNLEFPSNVDETNLLGHVERLRLPSKKGVLAFSFFATGTTNGPLPRHHELIVKGSITMSGVAYYEIRSGRLLAIQDGIQLRGRLYAGGKSPAPVAISYIRKIYVLH